MLYGNGDVCQRAEEQIETFVARHWKRLPVDILRGLNAQPSAGSTGSERVAAADKTFFDA